MLTHRTPWLPALALLILAACAGETEQVEEAPAEAPSAEAPPPARPAGAASVTITAPAEGASVAGPAVNAVLTASGVTISPAGTMEPGTGHHHLFLDIDVTPMGEPIPAGTPGITHLGQAQTEFTLEGVAAGQHRLIAVLADGAHVPLDPPLVDTVMFTVP